MPPGGGLLLLLLSFGGVREAAVKCIPQPAHHYSHRDMQGDLFDMATIIITTMTITADQSLSRFLL
jgi:hypothetical protein